MVSILVIFMEYGCKLTLVFLALGEAEFGPDPFFQI
jgi:hypothetical protein